MYLSSKSMEITQVIANMLPSKPIKIILIITNVSQKTNAFS